MASHPASGGSGRRRRAAVGLVVCAASVALFGRCGGGIFNPAFVSIVDPSGASTTIDNPPGHVIVAFVNNATVDERLLDYMESAEGGGLDLSDAERATLHPRVRLRLLVTFANGNQNSFEFVSGSTTLVEPGFDAQADSDLNQNTLENVVFLCDVQQIAPFPGDSIEVFVPVTILGYRPNEDDTVIIGEQPEFLFELATTIPPHFEALEVDQIDFDGNTTVQANIGINDTLVAAQEPGCGAVVAVIMNGVLDVPFLDAVGNDPSYNIEDVNQTSRIGGRYEFQISIK